MDQKLRTLGANRDGTLRHEYNEDEWRLVPLGHLNWKWNDARKNYPTYEQEIMSGVLLSASQTRIVGSNPVTWFCDQEPAQAFLHKPPPQQKWIRRWWTFLSQLPLATFHIPGVKNELRDYLSRGSFNDLLGRDTEELAKKAFAKMDVQLDLFAKVTPSRSTEWKVTDLLPKIPILTTLKEGQSFVDDGGVQLARTSSHLYREEVICVPSKHVKSMRRWADKTNGHPGVERTRWFFEKHFHTTLSQERLNEVLREVCTECPCSKAKQSTSADHGLTAHMPIPRMVNSVLYLEFAEMPKYSGHNFALLVTCGLSRFTRVFPLTKKCDGGTVFKELLESWIQANGMPNWIHSDRDIRFTSSTGWYTGVLKNMGVEIDFGTPNYKNKNRQCERQIKAFKTITRILLAEESSRNEIKLVPVALYMMNNHISSRTGYSPNELFLKRPGFFFEFPTAQDCNTTEKG